MQGFTKEQAIKKLEEFKDKLGEKNQNFAASLIKQFKAKSDLSPKQWIYVFKLIDLIDSKYQSGVATHPIKPPVQLPQFNGVIGLFQAASVNKLKFPKIKLQDLDGKPLVLALAGKKSKYYGQVLVTKGLPFGTPLNYYGCINKEGVFNASFSQPIETLNNIVPVLKALANSPVEVAAKYGKLTGNCCFCQKALTDEKSTNAGFGPVCAKKFGLGDAYKNAQSPFSSGTTSGTLVSKEPNSEEVANFDKAIGDSLALIKGEPTNKAAKEFTVTEEVFKKNQQYQLPIKKSVEVGDELEVSGAGNDDTMTCVVKGVDEVKGVINLEQSQKIKNYKNSSGFKNLTPGKKAAFTKAMQTGVMSKAVKEYGLAILEEIEWNAEPQAAPLFVPPPVSPVSPVSPIKSKVVPLDPALQKLIEAEAQQEDIDDQPESTKPNVMF